MPKVPKACLIVEMFVKYFVSANSFPTHLNETDPFEAKPTFPSPSFTTNFFIYFKIMLLL